MASYGANTQNAAAQAYSTALGTGSLVIYAGTPPANAKAALGSNPVLATHTMTGFSVTGGVLTANAIVDVPVAASGTPTFVRVLVSGVAQYQENVGTGVTVSDSDYVENGTSKVTSFVITVPSE